MANTKLVADILQNVSVQNVNKAFVYVTDWTSPLMHWVRIKGGYGRTDIWQTDGRIYDGRTDI